MKTIAPGRPQQGWATEATCTGLGNGNGGCKAKLLVEQADLYRTESHARDETTPYTTFTCSQCGVETDLQDSSVPTHVRQNLPLKRDWERRTGAAGQAIAIAANARSTAPHEIATRQLAVGLVRRALEPIPTNPTGASTPTLIRANLHLALREMERVLVDLTPAAVPFANEHVATVNRLLALANLKPIPLLTEDTLFSTDLTFDYIAVVAAVAYSTLEADPHAS